MADITNVLSVVRESLIRDPSLFVKHVIVERLVGNEYGYDPKATVNTVVRETLTKEPSIYIGYVVRETLVRHEDVDLTQARFASVMRQQVVHLRDKMADPSDVHSMSSIASFREQVLSRRNAPPQRGYIEVWTLVRLGLRRLPVAAYTHSYITPFTLRQQVLQSRTRAYVPVSMVYAATERQQVLGHRDTTAAGNVRSPINAGKLTEQVLQSRVRGPVVIMTYAYAETLAQLVLQQDTRPAPISTLSVNQTAQLVLQQFEPPPPGIDDRVSVLRHQVLHGHTPIAYIGVEQVNQVHQQALVARTPLDIRSPTLVSAQRQVILQHRETYPPQYALGRQTYSLWEQVAQRRLTAAAPIDVHSTSSVAQARLQFMLFRTTPRPIDVIDPAIGRHVAQFTWATLQHRVTPPPSELNRSRFVYAVVGQVVVGDAFPPPPYPQPVTDRVVNSVVEAFAYRDRDWAPVSRIDAKQVVEVVALDDNVGWIDPTIPFSTVTVEEVAQSFAVGDSFPDPASLAQSDAVLIALTEAVALVDDALPDPTIPQSSVSVHQVFESAAIGDVDLPDPTIPLSSVTARSVTAFYAALDASLTGPLRGSAVRSASVLEAFVVPDKSLVGIPLRKGPRPVVTVSMS